MSDSRAFEPNRRSVFRGGAIGAGALIGTLGLGAGTAGAAVPIAAAADDSGDGSDNLDAEVAPAAAAAGTTGDLVFLKLDGIAGDSTHKGFEDWIELADFSWGAKNTTAASSGSGAGAGKAQPTNVVFSATTSKASPLLLRGTVTGKHIASGQVAMVKPGDGSVSQFIKIELTDIGLDFYKIDMLATGLPTDRGSLTFAKVKFSYYPQDPKGTLGDPVTVEWDTRSAKF